MTVKKQGDFGILRDDLHGTTNEPTYAGVTSFMRRKYTRDLDGVDLVVTGVPLDTATTNRPGTRFGPRSIRAGSSMISWMRPYDTELDPFDKLAVVDYGDCFFDFGRPETIPDAIEAHATEIISQGPGLLTLDVADPVPVQLWLGVEALRIGAGGSFVAGARNRAHRRRGIARAASLGSEAAAPRGARGPCSTGRRAARPAGSRPSPRLCGSTCLHPPSPR